MLRELATPLAGGREQCQLQLALLDLASSACTSTWKGPALEQDQQFWVRCNVMRCATLCCAVLRAGGLRTCSAPAAWVQSLHRPAARGPHPTLHPQPRCMHRTLGAAAPEASGPIGSPRPARPCRAQCVDFHKHGSVAFGVQAVALWRRGVGVSVVGVRGSSFTGLLWQLPGAASPSFTLDGYALAVESAGRAQVHRTATGRLLATWEPPRPVLSPSRHGAPPDGTATAAVQAVSFCGPGRRQLSAASIMHAPGEGSHLLLSMLGFG